MNNDKSESQNQNVKPDKKLDPWRVIARFYKNSCNCENTPEGQCIACALYTKQAKKELDIELRNFAKVLSEAPHIETNEPPCSCCRLQIDVEILSCGHGYCYICRGREHHDPCWLCEEAETNKIPPL